MTSYSFFKTKLSLFLQSIRNRVFIFFWRLLQLQLHEEYWKSTSRGCKSSEHCEILVQSCTSPPPSSQGLSEPFSGCVQMKIWWFSSSLIMAMMDTWDSKLLAVNRCSRSQTLKWKALTWKKPHPSAILAHWPSAEVLRSFPVFLLTSITHNVLT